MNLVIPKLSMRTMLNDFWRKVRGTPMGDCVQHAAQAPLAFDLHRTLFARNPLAALQIGRSLFRPELRGAGYAWESRRWLQPASDAAIATNGANSTNFNIGDFFQIQLVGFVWTVAGTVTALVMDFDLYTAPAAGGTVTDKLDGSSGVITAPTVAGQAIGAVLYKDLTGGLTGSPAVAPIHVSPGNSIQAIVTTTTTAGNGIPFVIGSPRAETFANLSTAVRSS